MILVFRLRLVHYKYMDNLLFEQYIYLCIAELKIYICQIRYQVLGTRYDNFQCVRRGVGWV